MWRVMLETDHHFNCSIVKSFVHRNVLQSQARECTILKKASSHDRIHNFNKILKVLVHSFVVDGLWHAEPLASSLNAAAVGP